MDGINEGLKEAFKYTFIAIIIIASFMMVYFVNTDFNDKFDITINNQELIARYDSEYVKYFLKRYGGSNYNISISSDDNSGYFNKLAKSDNYYLDIKEYEAYNKFGHRESYEPFFNQELREVFDDNKTMMVQKDEKIIYEGNFKNDITDIITEDGRYYFHVYTKQKRPSSPFGYSKTSLHFCFLVGDYYE